MNLPFVNNAISIDEKKVSALIIAFFIILIPTAYVYYKDHVIIDNMKDIIGYFIAGIAGINVVNSIKEVVPNNTEKNKE